MEENVTLNTVSVTVEKKKRGRKKLVKPDPLTDDSKNCSSENKIDIVKETITDNLNQLDTIDTIVVKKERKQRKLKNKKQNNEYSIDETSNDGVNVNDHASASLTNVVVHKKRGRKPRGGKIIHENQIQTNNNLEVPNIILHLKCVLSDLKKTNESNSHKINIYNDKKTGILCYNDDDQNNIFSSHMSNITSYENCDKNRIHKKNFELEEETNESTLPMLNRKYDPSSFSSKNLHSSSSLIMNDSNADSNSTESSPFGFLGKEHDNINECNLDCKNTTNKEIWKKISQLKFNFHKNDSLNIRRSACFWDTCEFDTPPIHIPMSSTKGYGCFCHPECAVAFLMNENIDTSIKFERYYLLNSIYGPIYNYNKSIKPAANPHYLLNKFYGDLTISEYRKLFQCEQVIYMVNKPLTNVLPELYEDNNDFFIGNKIIQNNTIEIKKKVVKNPKSSIINEAFGIK